MLVLSTSTEEFLLFATEKHGLKPRACGYPQARTRPTFTPNSRPWHLSSINSLSCNRLDRRNPAVPDLQHPQAQGVVLFASLSSSPDSQKK